MILYGSMNNESGLSSQDGKEKEQCLEYFERWPVQEQVHFVKSLLSQMSHQQLQRINSYLTPMLQRDIISLLAKKDIYQVAEKIFSYLDETSLHQAEMVCKEWRKVIKTGPLWRNLICRKIHSDYLWRNIAERRGWMKHMSQQKHVRLDVGNFSYANFLKVKKSMNTVDERWVSGKYELRTLVYESNQLGVYCLQYIENKLVTGHRDGTIRIWDLNSLQCIKILHSHQRSVLCLQCYNDIIISGSSDNSIRVWDMNSGEKLNTLPNHTDSVLHLRILNNILVSSSKDKSIIIWDFASPSCITLRKTLTRHRGAVNVIEMDEHYIVSASGDRTIRLWSTSNGDHIRTLRGHDRGITSLYYKHDLIVSGSSDNTIRIWSMSGLTLRTLEGHTSLVRSLKFNEKYLVSGDYDGKIKVWDFAAALNSEIQSSKLCLQTLHEHTESVFSIQFDNYQIISSSTNNVIFIWDFLNSKADIDFPCAQEDSTGN